MVSLPLQQKLFEQVKAQIPPNVSFADELAALLGISNDSAYRRIRGEKQLSLEELQTLCRKYRISVDAIMSLENNSIVFKGGMVSEGGFEVSDYLKQLLQNLKQITQATNKTIYYEAKDIPLFYFFHYPQLAAFKYFFWMKSILAYPSLGKQCFEDNELVLAIQQTGSELVRIYNTIPSVEIWSLETVNSIIKQILYYSQSGAFRNKETAHTLLAQLGELVNHIKDQAEHGCKFLPGQKPVGGADNFRLFANEVFIGQNTVMVTADNAQLTFINHNVLNYMATADAAFCAYTKQSLDNAMKKSVLISAVGEKDRNIFFNQLSQQIADVTKEIEKS